MLTLYVLSNVFKHQILVKKMQSSLSTGTVQTQKGEQKPSGTIVNVINISLAELALGCNP